MVGGQDGWFLEQVIGKAAAAGVLDRLKMKLTLASEEKSGLTSANAVATIPGQSPKRIIVNAHADGYFQGGDDNASGLAVLVALARYFAKQPQPKHTLMFVASGGHHGPGNGPASLVAAHPELKDGTLMIINLEHVASPTPALSWSGAPKGTKSFALIVDDPDAPDPAAPKMTWVHWVLYDIPAAATGVPEAVQASALPPGTREGVNDWGRTGFGGPCPPIGRHRYFHKLYALDAVLPDLKRPKKAALEKAMQGHILAQAVLIGTYQKRK